MPRRPWRSRISNPIAVFAAIMLLASTQVKGPEGTVAGLSVLPEMASKVEEQVMLEFEESTEAAVTPASSRSPKAKKKRGLSLDLLQFRR